MTESDYEAGLEIWDSTLLCYLNHKQIFMETQGGDKNPRDKGQIRYVETDTLIGFHFLFS